MAFDALTFLQRELAKPPVPSTRRSKQQSGRANLRKYRSSRWVGDVGGKVSPVSAIYDGNDDHVPDPEEGPTALCHVVDREIKAVRTPGGTQPDYRPTGGYGYVGRAPCV
jgi:hypothetical protein